GPGGGSGTPVVVVVDPPRAGLHPRVVARVAELAPARIVYVSCNPATLARDLKDFAAHGWRAAEVTPYDMFPHTADVERVARPERAAACADAPCHPGEAARSVLTRLRGPDTGPRRAP